jgi:hypothetical protein
MKAQGDSGYRHSKMPDTERGGCRIWTQEESMGVGGCMIWTREMQDTNTRDDGWEPREMSGVDLAGVKYEYVNVGSFIYPLSTMQLKMIGVGSM